MASEDQTRFQHRLQDAAVMTGRVAHAFDNVLTGILGFAELTLSQVPPESAPHQYVGEVLRAAQLGVALTQELHQFSRCGMPGTGPTALAPVISEEEARLHETGESRIPIRLDLAPDLPPIAIDPDALRQVLRHLLNNARESGSASISIAAHRTNLTPSACAEIVGNAGPGPFVEVVIADSGSGMSPEARQRWTSEPFFSTKPRHRGLGLAIVCRILFTQRGGLRLDPAPERGTVARVFLPVTA